MAFVLGEVCFCGDLILGRARRSSRPRPAAARSRLHELARAGSPRSTLALLAPGHGPWITDPAAKIAEYVEHRLERERRLLAALDAGERSRAALLAAVWDDVPEQLRPAAAIAMQAHLEKLEAEDSLDPAELVD